jgi:hypothetical protein
MAWVITSPASDTRDTPDYGSVSVESISATSSEIIPAGTKGRFVSVSSATDSGNVYISYGVAVNVTTKVYNYIIPPGFQHHKMEIPAQAIHAATATGETATLVIGIAS